MMNSWGVEAAAQTAQPPKPTKEVVASPDKYPTFESKYGGQGVPDQPDFVGQQADPAQSPAMPPQQNMGSAWLTPQQDTESAPQPAPAWTYKGK